MTLSLCLLSTFSTYSYGITDKELSKETDTIDEIQKEYGIDIIVPDNAEILDIHECLASIKCSLGRFPEGMISEITEQYMSKGVKTRFIINTIDNIIDLPSEYALSETNADININILSGNYYDTSNISSLDGIVHELSRFISDYLVQSNKYEEIKKQFKNLNAGYPYGSWGDDYYKVYVNSHSALGLYDDLSDLIWYAEAHPNELRNVNSGEKITIHRKLEALAKIFDECFDSVTKETKLWKQAIPNDPDVWAKDIINNMIIKGMIPKDFEGNYESYISRKDFYLLCINIIKEKLGEDNFYKYFNIPKPESFIKLDPISGESIIDDGIPEIYYDINICDNKKEIFEAYNIGLINYDGSFEPDASVTRLDAANNFAYICSKFGIDISDYTETDYDDISDLSEIDKSCLYFVSDKGIMNGYESKFMPYKYCTYQEVYIMLSRIYELI